MVVQLNNSIDANLQKTEYQICSQCIMDTTDPDIQFDELGICSHCRKFEHYRKECWFPNEDGEKQLNAIIQKIKQENINNEYDCIIGLSGGVDSSYLAYKAIELGLRPLAVHVDAGWNSELAVKNIENIVKKLNIDLFTHVVDWEEMQDLQVAFLKSGVANQDVPQDHAFFAALYGFAVQNNIRYVLSGSNIATESILPQGWGYDAMDAQHLKSIHKKFGKSPLKTFPIASFFKYHFYYPYIRRMKVIAPLNFMYYNKDEAISILEKKLDWRYYGGKHYESRFTKFFQGYYLPHKFGYDKRKAHLSSLIVSGQLSREMALKELSKDPYPLSELKEDKAFISKKLGLKEGKLEELLTLPDKNFKDYPSNYTLRKVLGVFKRILSKALKKLDLH